MTSNYQQSDINGTTAADFTDNNRLDDDIGGTVMNSVPYSAATMTSNDGGQSGTLAQSQRVPELESRMTIGELDTDYVDSMLSEQLNNMSFCDRNQILEEVHGVRNLAVVESPPMVNRALWMLEQEIGKIQNKAAYNQAKYVLRSSFVDDPEFRLRCLRAALFDVKEAARKLTSYLDLCLDYFGPDALTRPIKASDLGSDGLEFLRSGETQLLPFRDRSGRRVMAVVGEAGLSFTLSARMKLLIYIWWVAGVDVETQQRGVVTVFLPSFDAAHKFPDKREHVEADRVFSCMPTRLTALHNCSPDEPIYKLLQAVLTLALPAAFRSRIKFHNGTPTEIQYQLMGFGIPVDLLPLTGTGKVKVKNLQQWIKTRRVVEETQEGRLIECPYLNDVCFRFGMSYLSHPGNSFFRALVEEYFNEHSDTTAHNVKVAVTWRLIEEIERKNGRFLNWDNRGWWTELTDRNVIRSKVAASLKMHKKRILAQNNRQSNVSSTFEFERQDLRKRKRAIDGTEVVGPCACGF